MIFLLIACTSSSSSYAEKYAVHPDKTLSEIVENEAKESQEPILLDILSKHPKDASRICARLHSDTAKAYCARYQTRPHLWTIATEDTAPLWTGGVFLERVIFPAVEKKKIEPIASSCGDNVSCVQRDAGVAAAGGQADRALGLCASLEPGRARWDCMFTASEQLVPPAYRSAVQLCLEAGPYAPECHNHLLLKMATWGWIDPSKHQTNMEQIGSFWSNSQYNLQLMDLYWSMVAARVAGVTQPFAMEDFESYPPAFSPHLRSAIALRAIFAADPVAQASQAQQVDHMQLTKAHGPNSPRFRPRPIWSVDSKHRWIYFCDIRGGLRPTSDDPVQDMKLALMTAAAMHVPPRRELIVSFLADENALVRWAAQALQDSLNR